MKVTENTLLILVFIAVLLTLTPCLAQNILVWKNDNQSAFVDPEDFQTIHCDYGLKKALTANGYAYTGLDQLPEDLRMYDVIFITLGFSVDCG